MRRAATSSPVIGGGTYLTVTGESPTGPCADCIVKVDPTTGAVLSNIGHLGHGAVFGLAFWGGSCYGFDAEGEVFRIYLTNATTTLHSHRRRTSFGTAPRPPPRRR